MFARILSGSLILTLVLVIWLFGLAVVSPKSAQQPQREYGLVSKIWEPTTVYARSMMTPDIASRLQLLDDGRRVVPVYVYTAG